MGARLPNGTRVKVVGKVYVPRIPVGTEAVIMVQDEFFYEVKIEGERELWPFFPKEVEEL